MSKPWRLLLATLAAAVLGSAVQTAAAASPEGPPPGMGAGHPGMHPGMGPGVGRGLQRGPEGPGGDMRHMGRLLDLAKATAEQRSQIHQIMQAARQELQAQREAGRKLREQQAALLTQPTVDAAAVEALRQQMLSQHDQASKRMTQALLEWETLDADQLNDIMAGKPPREPKRSAPPASTPADNSPGAAPNAAAPA